MTPPAAPAGPVRLDTAAITAQAAGQFAQLVLAGYRQAAGQVAGVDADRVYQVSGKAGSDPLYPDDPTLAGNRRIAIVLLREAPVLPTDTSL